MTFIVEGLLKTSFDAKLHNRSAKKLAKLTKVYLKEDEFKNLCLKVGSVQSVNLVVHLIAEQIDKKFAIVEENAKVEENKLTEAAAKNKGNFQTTSNKGTGYNFQDSIDIKALMELRSRTRAKKFAAVLDETKALKTFLGFEEIFSSEHANASTFSCFYQSRLNSFLGMLTEDNSVLEISTTLEVWSILLDICLILSQNPNFIPVLRPKVDGLPMWIKEQVPIFERLTHVQNQFLQIPFDDAEPSVLAFAEKLKQIFPEIEKNVKKFDSMFIELKYVFPEEKYDYREEKVDPKDEERLNLLKYLREMQFETADLSQEPFRFAQEVTDSLSQPVNKQRLNRIRKELSILTHALPDGIFVRVNEERPDIIKVLITGPADTPYENGCFMFDLFLPVQFPENPPKMRMLTTGNGYRFNPNLYTDGYVCLSLLGTWKGPGWIPETSTLLQLLVSLQAMVFCEEPYCNEPGWYSSAGSEDSQHYSKQIRKATALYAMLWHLNGERAVPAYFEKVIKGYLYMKKDEILAQLKRWNTLNTNLPDDRQAYSSEQTLTKTWEETRPQLEKLIKNLEHPLKCE